MALGLLPGDGHIPGAQAQGSGLKDLSTAECQKLAGQRRRSL